MTHLIPIGIHSSRESKALCLSRFFYRGPADIVLFNIPQPLSDSLQTSLLGYQWFYVAMTATVAGLVYLVVHRITNSPLGRALRAVRDNPDTASAIGRNVTVLRMTALVLGAAIAGLSGALLAQSVTAWAPGSWLYPETFVYLAAVIVGGSGNNFGVMLGALLVPGFGEVTRFFPQLVDAQAAAAIQWIGIGLFLVVFLWFWPRGIVPERRRRFPRAGASGRPVAIAETGSRP